MGEKMKAKEIVKKYNVDRRDFFEFIKEQGLKYELTVTSWEVEDSKVEEYINMYEEWLKTKDAEEAAAKAEAVFKEKAMSEMLITSGFTFDGYTITKYSGYISGDDAVQIPRSGIFKNNDNGQNLTNALVQIRRQALKELKEAAYNLGCNAVIGVDFDYITLEPETANVHGGTMYEPYVICVTANGNAVVIEKNKTNVRQDISQQDNN
jgi:uncharacterized protein YbjQ (UPF0145 family)